MIDVAQIDERISDQSLAATLSGLVNIASPTGEEACLAAHIAKQLSSFGYDGQTQNLGGKQANALSILKGKGGGRNFLLYTPIDTVSSNNETEDLPWIGSELRPDMRSKTYVKDGHVFGLGAHNPKGHAACIIEAARILKAMGIELAGDIHFGFGAGGMPTHSRAGLPDNTGHGVGCVQLLSHINKPDAAIIAKSGSSVTWEEVGFVWMDVHVEGIHTYVGSIHLLPFKKAISNAAKLILKLESWFEKRSKILATDCVEPQGVVSFIQSGWERMPAFTPATARFRIDLRFGPDMTSCEAEAEFKDALEDFSKDLNIKTHCHCVQIIEASRTDFKSEIVQTAIGAWKTVKDQPHQPFTAMSGATDANIIRHHSIPTARMGLPKAQQPDLDFQLGMNCAAIADMRALTAMLILSASTYCGKVA